MAKSKPYVGAIPFDSKGNLQHYPATYSGCVWKANFEFFGTLQFLEFNRGRSAAYAVFGRLERGEVRSHVTVFLTDLADLMPYVTGAKVTGTFTFCKRGQNYGCKLLSAA